MTSFLNTFLVLILAFFTMTSCGKKSSYTYEFFMEQADIKTSTKNLRNSDVNLLDEVDSYYLNFHFLKSDTAYNEDGEVHYSAFKPICNDGNETPIINRSRRILHTLGIKDVCKLEAKIDSISPWLNVRLENDRLSSSFLWDGDFNLHVFHYKISHIRDINFIKNYDAENITRVKKQFYIDVKKGKYKVYGILDHSLTYVKSLEDTAITIDNFEYKINNGEIYSSENGELKVRSDINNAQVDVFIKHKELIYDDRGGERSWLPIESLSKDSLYIKQQEINIYYYYKTIYEQIKETVYDKIGNDGIKTKFTIIDCDEAKCGDCKFIGGKYDLKIIQLCDSTLCNKRSIEFPDLMLHELGHLLNKKTVGDGGSSPLNYLHCRPLDEGLADIWMYLLSERKFKTLAQGIYKAPTNCHSSFRSYENKSYLLFQDDTLNINLDILFEGKSNYKRGMALAGPWIRACEKMPSTIPNDTLLKIYTSTVVGSRTLLESQAKKKEPIIDLYRKFFKNGQTVASKIDTSFMKALEKSCKEFGY